MTVFKNAILSHGRKLILATLAILTIQISHAQNFVDASSALGILDVMAVGDGTGNGVSFYDWNKDGLDDLSFCQIGESPKFYVNTGCGFQIIPSFFESTGNMRQLAWVDYDNDGDLDIFVTYDSSPLELYQNDGCYSFTEVAAAAGFPANSIPRYGFCWGDYDQDGFLDVYVSSYWGPAQGEVFEIENHLYHNEGDGTFTDVTMATGTGNGYTTTYAPIWFDYDNDGDIDLYVVNDKFMVNALYRNDGGGNFTDVSNSSGAGVVVQGMTASSGDFNDDGWLDMYITNTTEGNVLLMNNQDGTFTDAATDVGLVINEIMWGAAWMDSDLDGDQDIYIATQGGFDNGNLTGTQNLFYRNDGGTSFVPIHNSNGLQDDDTHTYCVAVGDANMDGFPDFIEAGFDSFAAQLWVNDGSSTNHHVQFTLEGTVSNKEAIGSRIRVYSNGQSWMQFTYCGENFLGQNSQNRIFGLGESTVVDSVVVDWPNGMHQNFGPVQVDQHYDLIEGIPFPPEISSDSGSSFCAGGELVLSTSEYFSYSWSTGEESQSITVTEPGDYSVTIFTESGVELSSNTFTVTNYDPFEWALNVQPISCYGESGGITFSPISANEYTSIQWTDAEGSALSFTDTLTNVAAGTYSVSFTDSFGCPWQETYELTQPDSISLDAMLTDVSCFGLSDGSVDMTVSGGTPVYYINWMGEDNMNLSAGTYSVQVTDTLGCNKLLTFTISEPDDLLLTLTVNGIVDANGGSATASTEGGTPPYTIEWSNGTIGESIDALEEGSYTVLVTDDHGCTVEDGFAITDVLNWGIQATVIYPNPATNYLVIQNRSEVTDMVYTVFNALGQEVVSMSRNGQDKITVDVSDWPIGVYSIRIQTPLGAQNVSFLKM